MWIFSASLFFYYLLFFNIFCLWYEIGAWFPYFFSLEISNYSSTGGSDGKESVCNAGELGSIPGSRQSPGEGNGNPLHARRSLWTEEPGRLQSVGLQKVGHDERTDTFTFPFFTGLLSNIHQKSMNLLLLDSVLFHWSICLTSLQPHCLINCSFIVHLKIKQYKLLNFVLCSSLDTLLSP